MPHERDIVIVAASAGGLLPLRRMLSQLSGTLDDAALGSPTVEGRGGQGVVQDPDDAEYDSMPRNVIAATSDAIVVLTTRLAEAAQGRGHEISARQFGKTAEEARQAADVIREVANGMVTDVDPEPDQA